MPPVTDALKVQVIAEVEVLDSTNPAPLVSAKQNGAAEYVREKLMTHDDAAPDHVTDPTISVDPAFMAGSVPHVPAVGVVPDEIIMP